MQQQTRKNKDEVVLVDAQDEKVGVADKIRAHRGQGQLHRAVSVFLFNQEGKLLVQQRSKYKIVAASKWANTACGNVWPEESYLECAARRLKQELGIKKSDLDKLGKFRYHVEFENGFSEREIDTVFAGSWQKEPKPNPKEVQAVKWVELDKAVSACRKENWAPWLKHIFNQPEIFKSLKKYSKI